MIKEKAEPITLSLYPSDVKNLGYIAFQDDKTHKGGPNLSYAIRRLIQFYHDNNGHLDIKATVSANIPKPIDNIEVTFETSELKKLPEVDENDSSLDGILNRLIAEPFIFNLNGYPKELVFSETKVVRDKLAKRLKQELSSEIILVNQLIKYKKINDRIEAGKSIPSDFNPENHTRYSLIRDEIMSKRGQYIFPLANLVHQFNCIMNNHEQYYVERDGLASSVKAIERDPFQEFTEDVNTIIQDMVVDFDAEEMFKDMVDVETYKKHTTRLKNIVKNEEK